MILMQCIFEYIVFLIEELGDKVHQHVQYRHKIIIEMKCHSQIVSDVGRQWRKDQIVEEDLGHGNLYIGSGFEGEVAVERKVPKDR